MKTVKWGRLAILVFTAVIAGVACSGGSSGGNSPPPVGLTSSQAVTRAMPVAQAMSATPVNLITAKAGLYGEFRHSLPQQGSRWVWNVTFSGTFLPSGGAAPPAGQSVSPLPAQHSVSVVIDYSTGEFISAAIPAEG